MDGELRQRYPLGRRHLVGRGICQILRMAPNRDGNRQGSPFEAGDGDLSPSPASQAHWLEPGHLCAQDRFSLEVTKGESCYFSLYE